MDYQKTFTEDRIEHHTFSVHFARQYGINAAIIFENLYYWVKKNCLNDQNYRDGFYWTYNKLSAFAEYFPEMTIDQIKYAISKLIEEGLIKVWNYNSSKFDKTNWYTITEKGFKAYNGEDVSDIPCSSQVNESESEENPSNSADTPNIDFSDNRSDHLTLPNDDFSDNRSDDKSVIGEVNLPDRICKITCSGRDYYPTNTKYNTSLSNTNIISSNLLTTHVRARELGQAELESHIFERIGRNLSYPEKRIVSEWVDADEEIEIIDLAIGDNLFRKDKFDLKYARDTINTWKSRGAATSTEIRNMILDDHVINLRYSIRKEDEDDILGRSEIYGLQMQRDQLNDSYKRKDYQEFARISTMVKSDKVAQYLTEDVRKLYYTYRQIAI